VHACRPAPAVPSSRLAAPRAASACPPDTTPGSADVRIPLVPGAANGDVPPACRERHAKAPLPRSARILKAVDFNRVFERNAASNDGCFRLIARPSKTSVHRVGMAISRKVHRNAVERNRIKRIVRESFRQWRASSAANAHLPLDIVVLARPTAARRDNSDLFKSLERHWPVLVSRTAERFSGTTFSEEP